MSSKVSEYRSAMSIGVGSGSRSMWIAGSGARNSMPAERPPKLDPVALDQLAPHDHRDVDHDSIPFRKSMASCWSCCVAAQVMRSSPCFSL